MMSLRVCPEQAQGASFSGTKMNRTAGKLAQMKNDPPENYCAPKLSCKGNNFTEVHPLLREVMGSHFIEGPVGGVVPRRFMSIK